MVQPKTRLTKTLHLDAFHPYLVVVERDTHHCNRVKLVANSLRLRLRTRFHAIATDLVRIGCLYS